MRLPQRHHFCIWCGRALWDGQHSDEHIIPACLGGRLMSPDVCRDCNNRFGGESDWKLLNDQRIYQAARDAGLSHDQFMPGYEATATTNGGHEVKLRIREGTSRVVGGLSASPVHIASDATGRFSAREVANLRGMKKAEAKRRLPLVDPTTVDAEVDRIIDGFFQSGPAVTTYSPLLGEGFALDSTSHTVNVTRSYLEADTFRAMAKALYTLLKNVLPQRLERPMVQSLAQIARYATIAENNFNPVHFAKLLRPAARRHRFLVEMSPGGFRYEIILFDRLSWSIRGRGETADGTRVRLPGFRWEAIDDHALPDVTVTQER